MVDGIYSFLKEASDSAGWKWTVKTPRAGERQLICTGARPTELHIFLDTGSIEVFADGGRWVGTHRLDGFDRFTGIRLRGELSAVTGRPTELHILLLDTGFIEVGDGGRWC
ncbi:hypothetical protein GPALN_004196 [Globodera pallida]|nr:hypothetical protein GPALN_004196 [Globodera pallida]